MATTKKRPLNSKTKPQKIIDLPPVLRQRLEERQAKITLLQAQIDELNQLNTEALTGFLAAHDLPENAELTFDKLKWSISIFKAKS